MTATSPGGTTMFGDEDIANQKLINSAINLGGVGNFSKTDLAKNLRERKLMFMFLLVRIVRKWMGLPLRRILKQCSS